ncbi:Amidohydrolase [compost metagenome]
MYVDSHVHFWKLDRGDYTWIPRDNKVLAQDRLPAELKPILDAHDVEGVILVQAASTVAETDYMLELAEHHPWILGVVGGLQIAADEFQYDYERLRKNSKFAGIRINGSAFEEKDETRKQLILKRLKVMEVDGFPIDILARPHEIPSVLEFLKNVPDLKAVLNHLGVPPIKDQIEEPWKSLIQEIAAYPNTMVKISGMITQAGGYHPELLAPYISHLIEMFGPQRIMFASDWPVALLGGSYEAVVQLFEALLPAHWNEEEREPVRRLNAQRFYQV